MHEYYKTGGSVVKLIALAKPGDRLVVEKLTTELMTYIRLSNFINSAPTDIHELDTDQTKITNATRAMAKHLDHLILDPVTEQLFSWSANDSVIKEHATDAVLQRIEEGNYDLAMLELIYLWYNSRLQQNETKQDG